MGPKGQVVIPKDLREKYVLVEARENELAIVRAPGIEETLEWMSVRRRKCWRN